MDGKFTAGVQYDDWRGSAAADGADQADIHKFLEGKKLINTGEFVVGIELYVGAPGIDGDPYVGASAFVVKGADHGAALSEMGRGKFDARKIDLETETLNDFFRLFKRFNIKIMKKGLNLDGREYREVENL